MIIFKGAPHGLSKGAEEIQLCDLLRTPEECVDGQALYEEVGEECPSLILSDAPPLPQELFLPFLLMLIAVI